MLFCMDDLYDQDPKTINTYEQEAVNFLMESRQVTYKDIQDTIETSAKYPLVQVTARNLYETRKRLIWSNAQNSRAPKNI